MINNWQSFLEQLAVYCHKPVILAYSGGCDSGILLAALSDLSQKTNFPFHAVQFIDAWHTKEDIEFAQKFAGKFNIKPIQMQVDPLSDSALSDNPPNRCYLCKKSMFSQISTLAQKLKIDNIWDGSNADDNQSHRPGKQAANEFGIISPLAELGLPKSVIRQLAYERCLPEIAGRPAQPCLATRFPYHTRLDAGQIQSVGEMETYLKTLLPEEADLRVRHYGNRIIIEIPEQFTRVFQINFPLIKEKIHRIALQEVAIDLAIFSSGRMDKEQNTEKQAQL